jgi:fumarate hydratase, class I
MEDTPVMVAVDVDGNSVHESGPREWRVKIAELVEIGQEIS